MSSPEHQQPTGNIAHDLSLTQKKFRTPSIAQMSPEHQQPTGNTNSFNNINSLNNNSLFSNNNLFNNNNLFSNNNLFYNIVNSIGEEDIEGRQILEWLSPLEPQKRHRGVQADRHDSVGNWVLETSEFRKWRDAKDGCVEPVLFVYGNPGVGKTYVR